MNRYSGKGAVLVTALLTGQLAAAQELVSVGLSDVIKSQGTGNIDLFKDVTAVQLEQLRLDNDGALVFAVDINEDASGSEKASSQGVAVSSVRLTVGFDDGTQLTLDLAGDCCFSETRALLAEAPTSERRAYFTLLGESGSSRITANNTFQEDYDSTLTVVVGEALYNPAGRSATAAQLQVVLLQTNESLGDPEAYYDFSAGFEDLALLNAADAAFIDEYAAGREEAPTVILTNPPPVVDPLAVVNWNYFPSASSFYLVGYEDLYPGRGDYDFNDLTVAYRVQYGLNNAGDIVAIKGLAYLLTRGSSYSHNWHLAIALPDATSGEVSCVSNPDYRNSTQTGPCAGVGAEFKGGTLDIPVFSDTLALFPDPAGSLFVNTQALYSAPWFLKFFNGPRAEFRLDLDAPVPVAAVQSAPFDPYLHVLDTGVIVKLMEVDPAYQDGNGFPFGMLLTVAWKPPLEFTDTVIAYPFFQNFVDSEGAASVQWVDTFLNEYVVELPAVDQWAW